MTVESSSDTANVQNSKELACPVDFVLEILSKKWTVEILRELFLQPTRTRQFLRRIPGISMKSLSERLKSLEEHAVVERIVYPDRALKVEYKLTEKGRDLYRVLVSLKELGARWLNLDCICSFECSDDTGLVPLQCPHRPEGQG